MLNLVVEAYEHTDMTVLVKRHPKCRSRKIAQQIRKLTEGYNNVSEVSGSIHSYLEATKAVYTVNSGVGSEAIIYDLPIFTFGKSDYSAITKMISERPSDLSELRDLSFKPSTENLRKFYYFYRTKYQIEGEQLQRQRVAEILDGHGED